jgi:ADP-heptose:LPS heptosyltransferase
MMKKIERASKIGLARFISVFLGKRKITAEEFAQLSIERLLVIRQHNQMGDMLAAVPAFRGLRARFPKARITLVAAPVNADVMLRNPFVDEVIVYGKKRNLRSPFGLVRFVLDLRRRRFDAAIVLNTFSFSVTSMLLSVASGARVRVGSTSLPFGHDLSSRFYHLDLPLPPREAVARLHESLYNIYPLEAIGVRETDLRSMLVPLADEECSCERFIAASFGEGGRFVVVHPGAGKRLNRWPAGRFAEAAAAVHERTGCGIVAVGGPMDAEALDAFLEASRVRPMVLSCPSVGFMGALMKRSVLTLCNDTGIMHIAGAVGSPCVAVFGPTDPARWKPVNESVVAVRAGDGDVESVSVETVIGAAMRLLES